MAPDLFIPYSPPSTRGAVACMKMRYEVSIFVFARQRVLHRGAPEAPSFRGSRGSPRVPFLFHGQSRFLFPEWEREMGIESPAAARRSPLARSAAKPPAQSPGAKKARLSAGQKSLSGFVRCHK